MGTERSYPASPLTPSEAVIFMDWEFSNFGLIGQACLPISVGLVAPTGASLYLEFRDFGDCSEFAAQHVLPYLTCATKVSCEEAAVVIENWLSSQGEQIVLASDSDYDRNLMLWVAPTLCQRLAVRFANVIVDPTLQVFPLVESMRGRLVRDFDDAVNGWFLRTGKPRHHALNDAEALSWGWASIRGR